MVLDAKEVAMSTRRRLLPPAAALAASVTVLALALATGFPAVSGSTIPSMSTQSAGIPPTGIPSIATPSAGTSASRSFAARVPALGVPTSQPTVPVVRPPTPDGPVPANLQPTLANARQDYPQPYLDGCHTGENGKASIGTCLYGNLNSTTTIALFGDSHALAWFPAVERIAELQGWRLLSLTMSACSPADIRIWIPAWKRVSTECTKWREHAINRLVKERPAIILVAGTRGFELADSSGNVLSGDARTRAWEVGMQHTLARLIPAAGRVILIADTPLSRVDPPVCLAQHPTSVLACATPVAYAINQTWLGEEQRAAGQAGAGFIDPSLWVCPSSPCPVVLGHFLIFRNPGHLTATFAATLARRLDRAILTQI
jgi:SGNH domain (fused to AT3 domains)